VKHAAFVVEIIEDGDDLIEKAARIILVQHSVSPEEVQEVTALDKLHCDVDETIIAQLVIESRDERMVEVRKKFGLAVEMRPSAKKSSVESFDGDLDASLLVASKVDRPE
jgi:hypothetical protein